MKVRYWVLDDERPRDARDLELDPGVYADDVAEHYFYHSEVKSEWPIVFCIQPLDPKPGKVQVFSTELCFVPRQINKKAHL